MTRIDANSSVPIFRQIADGLRSEVAAGIYRPGDRIPSIRQLSAALLVNVNTVQRAYEQLEREGVIVNKRGIGMIVASESAAAAKGGSRETSRRRSHRRSRCPAQRASRGPRSIPSTARLGPSPSKGAIMSRTSAEYAISLDRVTKRFGGRPVVDDLSFRVRRGTTLGFIGLNGAGKTTAIRLMVGLLSPDAGRIEVDGIAHEQDRVGVKARIGYVPDRPNVYPWMRVDETIAFARSFHPRWDEARCRELMRMFRLDPTRRAGQLSKGQAAKLSLLLAIAHDPPVLILDEPANGLDPIVRDEFLENVLATAGDLDQTVLFSSHALDEVHRLADSVAFLHEGRLLLHGSIEDLLDRTKRVRAVREDESADLLPPPGTVFQQVNGREWLMTLENFDQAHLEFVRARNHVSHVTFRT